MSALGNLRLRVSSGLDWSWPEATLGAVYALPGAIVIPIDVQTGLALCVGVLPAAVAGLLPSRRARPAVALLGAMAGLSMLVGSVLSGEPVLAVISIVVLAVGAAALARHRAAGMLVMNLCVPLVGVGLSYGEVSKGATIAVLMLAGSIYAAAISMLWPERPASARPTPKPPTLDYGLRLGLAGATAAAIGFAADLSHVGWATAAAMLVMRPEPELQRLRTAGRLIAVTLGALVAIFLVDRDPAALAYSAGAVIALAGAAGTHRSRWYVTSAFTTYLVFLLLLYGSPGDAGSRFGERFLETILGVGLAYFFGLALPKLLGRANDLAR